MISADTMRSLPDCFADIDDPRRRQGRRHPLPTVLAIADGAIAIDGKTMRSAIHTDDAEAEAEARAGNGDGTRAADDAEPAVGKIGGNQYQVHILSAVGQRSGVTHTQKKSTASRSAADDETKRTPTASGRNEIGTVVPMLKDLRLDFRGRTFTADALLTQPKFTNPGAPGRMCFFGGFRSISPRKSLILGRSMAAGANVVP